MEVDAFFESLFWYDHRQPASLGMHERGRPFAVPPCFVCGRRFTETDAHAGPVWGAEGRTGYGMLLDGVICRTPGNFGSRIFDSDGEALIFVVCDACLDERRHRVQCFRGAQRVPRDLHLGRLRIDSDPPR